MRLSGRVGPYFETLEARSPDNPDSRVIVGVRYETFQQYVRWGLKSAIAQYYNIVQDGLMEAQHAFQGLARPMMIDLDMDADESVVIYCWRPETDWEWVGDATHGRVERREPAPNRVFVVLVRPEPKNQHGVYGCILKWNWVMQDLELESAPVEWKVRYTRKLWSRAR